MSENQCPGIQGSGEIRLIVRADDMGGSHAANMACRETSERGIVRSVEVMTVGPWFEESAAMLRENTAVDVGVHMVLTSEWDSIKWRPLTDSPSLVDGDGYFCPFIWPNPKRPGSPALQGQPWKIEEIEREFRAQIKLAKKKIPRASHLSAHMGCNDLDERVNSLYNLLGKEYGLAVVPEDGRGILKRTPGLAVGSTAEERVDGFAAMLKALKPGTYLYIEHPGMDDPEMKAFDQSGDVATDRSAATMVLTSPKVIEAVRTCGIRLVSYVDLAGGNR